MGMSGGPKEIAKATMLAAIVATSDGRKLYIKLVGPSDVVDPQTAKFDALLSSMKPK